MLSAQGTSPRQFGKLREPQIDAGPGVRNRGGNPLQLAVCKVAKFILSARDRGIRD